MSMLSWQATQLFPTPRLRVAMSDAAHDSQGVLLTYAADHRLLRYHHNPNKKVIWKK